MIIVLPYTATDNCSYFIPTYLFFEHKPGAFSHALAVSQA